LINSKNPRNQQRRKGGEKKQTEIIAESIFNVDIMPMKAVI